MAANRDRVQSQLLAARRAMQRSAHGQVRGLAGLTWVVYERYVVYADRWGGRRDHNAGRMQGVLDALDEVLMRPESETAQARARQTMQEYLTA